MEGMAVLGWVMDGIDTTDGVQCYKLVEFEDYFVTHIF